MPSITLGNITGIESRLNLSVVDTCPAIGTALASIGTPLYALNLNSAQANGDNLNSVGNPDNVCIVARPDACTHIELYSLGNVTTAGIGMLIGLTPPLLPRSVQKPLPSWVPETQWINSLTGTIAVPVSNVPRVTYGASNHVKFLRSEPVRGCTHFAFLITGESQGSAVVACRFSNA